MLIILSNIFSIQVTHRKDSPEKKMKAFLTLLLIASTSLSAAVFSKKDFTLALGAQANSLLYKRGIITYEGYQVAPIYSVSLFRKDLFIAGSAVYYNYTLKNNIRLLSRFNINSTKDAPLYITDEKEEERVRRDKTNEFDLFLQYDFTHSTYIRLEYSKDLVIHNGEYTALHARFDFKDSGSPSLIQPGLYVSIGQGDKSHNEYLYGAGASSGLNNIEYGFSIISPKAIDNFWPTLKITRFEILGDKNRNASFVQEKDGISLQLLVAKRLF
jgi:hypothetical protein